MNRKLVSTDPISTMNITGLRIIVRGFSFFSASTVAVLMIVGSKIDFEPGALVRTFGARGSGVCCSVAVMMSSEVGHGSQ